MVICNYHSNNDVYFGYFSLINKTSPLLLHALRYGIGVAIVDLALSSFSCVDVTLSQ